MTTAKTILITGATTGIGRHAAIHLAKAGHRVIASGRNEAALEKLKAEAGVALETIKLDVTSKSSIAEAAAQVDRLTNGQGVDALVNNAGYGQGGPIEELSDEDLRAQFETNVFGLCAVTRAFLPKMRARRSGRIVNVSSVGGRMTFPMFGAYHASKYAVEALSDALRNEVHPFGILVALIEPGPIRTEFSSRSVGALEKYMTSTSSPYAAVYARAKKIQDFADAQSVGPECVSEAIEHAITARRPRTRYVMPFSPKIMLFFSRWLPTRLMDRILRRTIGLTPKALAADAKQVETGAPQEPKVLPKLVESGVR